MTFIITIVEWAVDVYLLAYEAAAAFYNDTFVPYRKLNSVIRESYALAILKGD